MLTLRTRAPVADAMVHGLEQNGVTQDQMPKYLSQAVHATDPATGYEYYLVPDDTLATVAADIGEAFARELSSNPLMISG